MRRIGALSLLFVLSSTARADYVAPPRRDDTVRTTFWREAIEPHAVEVERLLDLARESLNKPDDGSADDTQWAVDERMKYYGDAYHLAAYAHRLSPANPDVLVTLGLAAGQLGRVQEARADLEAHVKLLGVEKAATEALAQLGAIYVREGDLDRAIAVLRYTQGPVRGGDRGGYGDRGRAQAQATVYLAQALSMKGDLAGALDVYLEAIPAGQQQLLYGGPSTLLAFGLAVQYDRMEMRGAAFEQLAALRSMLSQGGSSSFGRYITDEVNRLEFVPPEDLHYFRGLLYEAMGKYVESRAEWVLYAAIPDVTWRGRAEDHIVKIDTRARAVNEPPPPPATGPTNPLLMP